MTYPHVENDPQEAMWNRASTDEPFIIYGQISLHIWECMLVKGVGKVAYNPAIHAGERTSIAIDQRITPVDPTGRIIERNSLNWTGDWKGITRPSIEEQSQVIAGILDLVDGQFRAPEKINNMFVKAELVPRPDNKPGETWTCIKVMKVYSTREQCETEYWASKEEDDAAQAQLPLDTATEEEKQRASMAAFLRPMWAQVGGSSETMESDEAFAEAKEAFAEALEDNAMLANLFNIDSPEVTSLWENVEIIPF